jgi:hypothetical protein
MPDDRRTRRERVLDHHARATEVENYETATGQPDAPILLEVCGFPRCGHPHTFTGPAHSSDDGLPVDHGCELAGDCPAGVHEFEELELERPSKVAAALGLPELSPAARGAYLVGAVDYVLGKTLSGAGSTWAPSAAYLLGHAAAAAAFLDTAMPELDAGAALYLATNPAARPEWQAQAAGTYTGHGVAGGALEAVVDDDGALDYHPFRCGALCEVCTDRPVTGRAGEE